MSSGYFPLHKYAEHSDTLDNIIEDLEIVLSEYTEAVLEESSPEDAARDGVYLGYLRAAVELLRKCRREEA